ncbi:endonuclease NucS [Candidatus Woesearchaeota archaeon]|nr:endonuclease NucS [Candidatus Woesearchaeota archaeon]
MDVDVPAFNSAVSNGKTVILACCCSVSYSGRAESFLPEGDRILIIKSDGTLLVHQPHGSAAINYMKEGSAHRLLQNGEKLVLNSSNLPLKEFLTIEISRAYSVQILTLADSGKLQLSGSERDMSDMIFANPSLISPDFKPLSREEHTKYGFIDVFGYDGNNNLVVVECKRYAADFNAVDQLLRYMKKVRQLRGVEKVKGVIAAPKISANALKMLHDNGCEFREVNPPKYLERYDSSQKRLNF